MKQETKNSLIFASCMIAVSCAFFYFIFGISGALSILGITLIFLFPTYMILQNFNIDAEEKIVLSFFIGIGIFTPVAYWIGMIISFRIAIFISIIILAATGILIKIFRKTSPDKL